jgi:hypothetical protein
MGEGGACQANDWRSGVCQGPTLPSSLPTAPASTTPDQTRSSVLQCEAQRPLLPPNRSCFLLSLAGSEPAPGVVCPGVSICRVGRRCPRPHPPWPLPDKPGHHPSQNRSAGDLIACSLLSHHLTPRQPTFEPVHFGRARGRAMTIFSNRSTNATVFCLCYCLITIPRKQGTTVPYRPSHA